MKQGVNTTKQSEKKKTDEEEDAGAHERASGNQAVRDSIPQRSSIPGYIGSKAVDSSSVAHKVRPHTRRNCDTVYRIVISAI